MGSMWITNAVPLTQVSVAAASISGTYSIAGTFTAPVIMMMIVSTLDQPVQVSFDGVHDHVAVPAGSTVPVFMPFNFKDNCSVLPTPSISVKEIGNPTTGSLYVSAFSAQTP